MLFSTKYHSPLGEMLIISDGECINELRFNNQKHFKPSMNEDLVNNDEIDIFNQVKKWLDDYFNGLNPKINFKLKPSGTDFRVKVWKILTEIPYGESVTYGEIASKISPTMSAQAVGGAVGHNPIAIIIPCHRVLGANGKITGYAAGVDKKIELLKIEKILK